MRFKKDTKAKSKADKEDKAISDLKVVNETDDISLYASSQDSLMVEMSSDAQEQTLASNGNTDEPQAPQSSEDEPAAEPQVTKTIVETTDDNTPTEDSQTDKDPPPSHSEVDQASCSTTSILDDTTPREGETEADDAEVILIVDSPGKEDVPQPRALERIERSVRNLKSAFVQGEQELAELAREMNRLKDERAVNLEVLQFKKGGYYALKRSVEEGVLSRSTKRAKMEEEFLKEVQENFNSDLKRFEEEIDSLESKIRDGKDKEKANRSQNQILQGMFLNYSRTYEELMGGE